MSRIKKFAFAALAGVWGALLPATAATLGTPWEIDVDDDDHGFELWKSPFPNAISLWGEEDEMVAIPITDIGDDEELIPLVVYASATAKDVGPASIKTDQWLYNQYIAEAKRRFAKAKAEGDVDDSDTTFDEWLQDPELNWQVEPWAELWSAGAPDATRKWLCVPMKDVEWGSSRSLMVGLKGAPPSSFKIVYIGWEAALPVKLVNLVGLGIKSTFDVESYYYYAWGEEGECGLSLDADDKVGTLTITTPSAGRLVLARPFYYGDSLEEGGLTVTSPKLASPIDISLRSDDGWGALNDIVVDVSAATTITITVTDSEEEYAGLSPESIAFYRSDKPSVSVRAVSTLEEVLLAGEWWDSSVGYATGGNTYVAGDTVTLTAVPAPGEVFDRWVVDCELPAGTDLTSPTLKFKVTNAMVGTVDEQKTILAVATWKPRYDVFALSDPAGAGTVSGGGKYVAGQTVTLTAKDATKTQTFKYWADDPALTDPTRTVTVAASDAPVVYTAVYGDLPTLTVASEDETRGTVKPSGAKQYAAGTKVTLAATPKKGYVFAGWTDANGPLAGGVDWRTKSYAYTTTGADVSIFATFVTADEDTDSLALATVGDEPYDENLILQTAADGSLDAALGVVSASLPKLTVTGLPAGLKYDAKTMKISGKATKPGVYAVTLKATNASVAAKNAKTASFTIRVPNLETDKIDGLSPDMEAYGFVAGVAFDGDEITPAAAEGYTLSVSGLPSGLKYNSKTGEITGTPTAKAGSYTVTFTATPSAALKKQGAVAEKATITIAISYPVLKIEKWLETADEPESLDENALFKVTGAGSYAANKVVSLSATAPKGYVFVGWRWNDEPLDNQKQDYRTASGYKYTMSAKDVTIGAYFRPLQDDWAFVGIEDGMIFDLMKGEAFEYDLTDFIWSGSLPTVTITGLPSGIKYNAATHMLSGKPTDKTAKWYDIRISVKNAGGYTASAVIGASVNGGEPAEKDEIDLSDALADLDNLWVGDDETDWEAPIPSSLKVSVKNLPPGLELEREEQEVDDVLCDSILGTPTKGGVYYLTVTCKDPENARKTLTTVKRVVVRDPGSRYVTVEATEGGTASGSGVYAAGTTLKAVAKASKGLVFSYWTDDDGEVILNEDADYRQPTFSCIVGSGLPSLITAHFVSNDEDAGISINQYAKTGEYDEEEEPIYARVDEPWDYDCENPWKKFVFVVSSASLPKITVKGLPSGMTFSGESSIETIVAEPEPGAEMYGELCSYRIRVADATKLQPGEHSFTITAKNASGASATETFTVRVPNLETDKIDGLSPDMGAYRFVAGVAFDGDEIAPDVAEGYTLSVSGLPSGLKYNSKTGEITGTPTAKEGSYTVTFTATPSAALKKQGAVAEKATITVVITYPKLTLVPEVAEGLDPAIDATAVKFTLSGAGSYAVGKKVTIKATAPAGWLFGEWQLDGETYSQAASETFTMGEDDAALTAVFLHQSQDWLDFAGPVDEALNEAGYLELDLAVGDGFIASAAGDLFDSGTAATYTAKGLPTGLKFDTKTGAITGTATKGGRFYATVTAKNASGFTRTLLAKINVGDVEGEPDSAWQFGDIPALTVGDYYDIHLGWKWNGNGYQSCSGLPTGLKVVSKEEMEEQMYFAVGCATTPGWFTFVLTEKIDGQTEKTTRVLPVVDIPARYEFISCDAAEGTVTGGGVWAGGSTHTIKATPKAGYVFAGYFRDADFQEPATEAIVEESEWVYNADLISRGCEADYRNASLTWVVGGKTPERLYARFIPKSEATGDTTILMEVDDEEGFVPMVGEPDPWDVQPAQNEYGVMELRFESDTLPTVTVKGLPKGFTFSGLTYDGRAQIAYELSKVGARAEPGDYPVTITTKNMGNVQTTAFMLHVGHYRNGYAEWLSESYELLSFVSPDDWLADVFGAEDAAALAPTSETSDWGSSSMTWSVTGLPAGLSFNAKTGKITGSLKAVTQPTTYIVHFMCTQKYSELGSGSWSYVYDGTCAVTVNPVPAWAVGTYDGMMHWVGMDGDWESPGRLQVTVAANGKVAVDYVRIHPSGKGTEKDSFTAKVSGYDDEEGAFLFEIDCEDDEYWERGVGFIRREALDGENMGLGYCAWVEIETEGEDDDEDEFKSHHVAYKDVSADSALVPLFAQMEDFEWDLEIEEYPMNEHLQDEPHLVVGNLGLLFGADGKVTLDWESYNEEVVSTSTMPAHLVFLGREDEGYRARIEANVYEKGFGRYPGANRLIGIALELFIPCDGSVLDLENLETIVEGVIVDDEWEWDD